MLIEVLAGLLILGTILASLLIARGRFVRQQVLAQRKLQAIHALDQLVSEWTQGTVSAVPLHGSGSLPGAAHQSWRTNPVPSPSASELGAQIVRVEVFDPSDRRPIVTLDLLVHLEAAAKRPS